MSTSVKTHLDHFVASNHKNMTAFADALAKFDGAAINELIDRVAESKLVVGTTNLLNTSSAALGEFIDKLRQKIDSSKIIAGLTISAAGSIMWLEAAAIATVQAAVGAGIVVLSLKVVAVLLILYGLSIALPALWRLIRSRLDDDFDRFKELLDA